MVKKQKELDKLWSNEIKARDGYKCVICPNIKGVTAHHILPRTIQDTRHDLMNGLSLCSKCHLLGRYSAHKNALWFSQWMQDNRKEQYDYLMQKMLDFTKTI